MNDREIIQDLHRRLAASEAENSALRANEARDRAMIDSIDDGFCIIDVLFDANNAAVDYRFLEINPAFERQTGLVDAVGRTMRECAPGHESHWFDIYGQIARTGEPKRFENWAGALGRWYDVYAFRIGQPEQRQVGILFRDILQRKRSEAALREQEARFRAFVTASSDVVYRMSPDWTEMRRLDGRGFISDTAEPSTVWMDSYIHADDHDMVRTAIDHAVADRSVFELEHRVTRIDGTSGWTLSRAVPLFDGQGQVMEWLGAASDITLRRETEDARRDNEARQAFMLELSDCLRSAANPEEAMSASAELFARKLGLAVAHYLLFHPDQETFDIVGSYSDGRLPANLTKGSGRISDHGPGWGPQFRNGETIFSDDHDDRPAADAEASRALGIRSG